MDYDLSRKRREERAFLLAGAECAQLLHVRGWLGVGGCIFVS